VDASRRAAAILHPAVRDYNACGEVLHTNVSRGEGRGPFWQLMSEELREGNVTAYLGERSVNLSQSTDNFDSIDFRVCTLCEWNLVTFLPKIIGSLDEAIEEAATRAAARMPKSVLSPCGHR